MHFLDLAAAVEKLRWAEKEWRELDRELAEQDSEAPNEDVETDQAALGEDLVSEESEISDLSRGLVEAGDTSR